MTPFSSSARPIPMVPLILGLSGLIPFWGLAISLAAGGFGVWHGVAIDLALATYAAIIISFLGGIRWGLAVAAGDRTGAAVHYAGSVLPSLAAWAMLLSPEPWRLAGLGLLTLALGPFDRGLVTAGWAAPWFGRLRLILSSGAGLALLTGAAVWRG